MRGTRPSIFGVLLRILSSNHVASSRNRQISFHGAIIVVADGLNDSRVLRLTNSSSHCSRVHNLILGTLRGRFHPRFLGQMSSLVLFRSLQGRRLQGVITVRVHQIRGHLTSRGVDLTVASATVSSVTRDNCSPICKTHPLGHTVRHLLRGPVTAGVLRAAFARKTAVRISCDSSNLIFDRRRPPTSRPSTPSARPRRRPLTRSITKD